MLPRGHHFLHHFYFRKFISHSLVVVGGRFSTSGFPQPNVGRWHKKRKKSNFLFPFRLKNLFLMIDHWGKITQRTKKNQIKERKNLETYHPFLCRFLLKISLLGCVDWSLPGQTRVETNAIRRLDKCHSSWFFNT